MVETLKYPFRFSRGKAQTITVGSTAHDAQVISSAIQTARGELYSNPSFGTLPPEFSMLDISGLYSTIAGYYPQIIINEVKQFVEPSDGIVKMNIDFSNSGI